MTQDVQIKSVSLKDDGQSLHLTVKVHNPDARTRHLYSSFRALRYDAATQTLEVQLSDHGLVEPRSLRNGGTVDQTTFVLPSFTTIDPHADTELLLIVPRIIRRVSTAQSTAASLKFESLQAHEAKHIKVDIAWADTPFYQDPRRQYEHRKQLVDWAKGVASHTLHRQLTSEDRND